MLRQENLEKRKDCFTTEKLSLWIMGKVLNIHTEFNEYINQTEIILTKPKRMNTFYFVKENKLTKI